MNVRMCACTPVLIYYLKPNLLQNTVAVSKAIALQCNLHFLPFIKCMLEL